MSLAPRRDVTRLFARLVLGYFLALPLAVMLVDSSLGSLRSRFVLITMSSQVQGHIQLFFDSGAGYSEARSTTIALDETGQPHEYQLGLPSGQYRAFRLDPGTLGGRYTIERARIASLDGTVVATIPLQALAPGPSMTVVEQSETRLVIEAPPGPHDLRLEYVPPTPVIVPRVLIEPPVAGLIARLGALWLAAAGVVWLLERLIGRWASRWSDVVDRVRFTFGRHPAAAVCLVAVMSTGLATYPVWLLGRSLVTPNNFGVPLLYDWVPYTPGSTDATIEDVRGSDVAATLLQGIPHSVVERRALAGGEVPLWNRYNGSGRPLWGQGLSFLGDPLHWLTLVTSDPAVGWDLKFLAHRLVFSVGIGLAVRAVTGSVIPALVVTALAPFLGVFLYRLNHPAIFTLTYAPWVLLGWFRLGASENARARASAAALVSVSSALVLLGGTPKEAAIMLAGLETAGCLSLAASRGSWRALRVRVLAVSVAGVSAILLTAPHWLVFIDTLRESFTAYDTPTAEFATRANAVGFFLGPLAPGPLQPGFHLLAFVLVAAVVVSPGQMVRTRAATLCGVVAAFLGAIAFGAVPESWLVKVPFVGNIVHIHDVFLTAALPLILIVLGAGVEALRLARFRVGLAVAAVTCLGAVALLYLVRVAARDNGFEPWAVLLAAPMVIAVPLSFGTARSGTNRFGVLVATILAGTVLLLPGGLHRETGIAALDQLLIQPRVRTPLTGTSAAVETLHQATAPARVVGLNMTLFAGSQALYGIEGIGGADPLDVRVYRELIDASGMFRSMVWFTTVTPPDLERLAPLLDLLNVEFVLYPSAMLLPGLTNVALSSSDRLQVGRRTTAWPRAFFVDSVTAYNDAAGLLQQVDAAIGPFASVQRDDREANQATRDVQRERSQATPNEAVPARDYTLTANSTSFSIHTSGPGVVVLTETYLPRDFRATLNGQDASYFRVNHAFKAVKIPSAGEWAVTFEYRPRRWTQSLVLAILGFFILVGQAVTALRAGSHQ